MYTINFSTIIEKERLALDNLLIKIGVSTCPLIAKNENLVDHIYTWYDSKYDDRLVGYYVILYFKSEKDMLLFKLKYGL